LGGLTNYIIRHQPKYGNMMSPPHLLCMHFLGISAFTHFTALLECNYLSCSCKWKGEMEMAQARSLVISRKLLVWLSNSIFSHWAGPRKKKSWCHSFEKLCKAQILKTSWVLLLTWTSFNPKCIWLHSHGSPPCCNGWPDIPKPYN